jgi:hypothetical protein
MDRRLLSAFFLFALVGCSSSDATSDGVDSGDAATDTALPPVDASDAKPDTVDTSPADAPADADAPVEGDADALATDAFDSGDAAGAKCGDKTCAPTEYCLHPCCGGADTGTPCKPAPPYCTVTSCVAGMFCSGICPGGGGGYVDGTKKEIACVCA